MRLLRLQLMTAAALALVAAAPAIARPALLRLDGIGPLKLGMTRTVGVDTGWLAHRGAGCELGGPPLPITYRVDGARAPSGVRGSVEFVRGKLVAMSFSKGVRTATGVVVGKSTVSQMVSRYRKAGYSASSRFDATFQGTFVTVKRKGKTVLGGFATKKVVETLSIPNIQACE